jgi:hypothetical protein
VKGVILLKKPNTKKLAVNSLLLATGLILHQIMPVFGLPMEPDMALATLFLIILLNRDSFLTCLNAGLVTGVFTALTTKFPGGQLPNFIDKVVTTIVVYILISLLYKLPFVKNISNNAKDWIMSLVIYPLGTFVSGTLFLYSASRIVGLPASFTTLVLCVVVPATIINSIFGFFLVKMTKRLEKINNK